MGWTTLQKQAALNSYFTGRDLSCPQCDALMSADYFPQRRSNRGAYCLHLYCQICLHLETLGQEDDPRCPSFRRWEPAESERLIDEFVRGSTRLECPVCWTPLTTPRRFIPGASIVLLCERCNGRYEDQVPALAYGNAFCD